MASGTQEKHTTAPPQARDEWLAFDARLRRYVARRLGVHAEVDDIVQEVMARVYEALPSLRGVNGFAGWSYRIASHIVVDRLRARAREPLRLTQATLETVSAPTAAGLAGEELQADLAQCVAHFVARLEPPYREAITLTELEGFTQKAAAEHLGISLSAMKARVLRGRGKIRDMFEQCCRISTDCRGRVVDCESRPLDDVPEDCRAVASEWMARHGY